MSQSVLGPRPDTQPVIRLLEGFVRISTCGEKTMVARAPRPGLAGSQVVFRSCSVSPLGFIPTWAATM